MIIINESANLRTVPLHNIEHRGVYTVDRYEEGSKYTRTQIREIEGDVGINGKWNRGYLEHNDVMFIFSTVGGKAYTGIDHGDRWINEAEGVFRWNGTLGSKTTDKHIRMMIDGERKVRLFTRESMANPSKLKGTPFTYMGLVKPISVSGGKPVNIVWQIGRDARSYIDLDDEYDSYETNKAFSVNDLSMAAGKKVSKRSQKVKDQVLEQNDYICEVDIAHKTFISDRTKKNYVETHHIIPLSAQEYNFEYKLDCVANVSCLCPNCHRLIHYGT